MSSMPAQKPKKTAQPAPKGAKAAAKSPKSTPKPASATTAKKATPVTKANAKPATKVAAKPAPASPVKAAAKPAAKAAPKATKAVVDTTKRYKLLTGLDDSNFCQRVSDHLDAGYELAGAPVMVVKGSTVYVGQSIVRKATKKVAKRKKK
jgi:hypothetical protein